MFKSDGLNQLDNYLWQRALLTIGNFFLPSGTQNISFLTNSPNVQASWKRLLRGTRVNGKAAREVLKKLFDRIDLTESTEIEAQLGDIICAESASKQWKQALIETPEAFEYCKKKAIRKYSDGEIYLLKNIQMNGYHAELFTYYLFYKLRHLNATKFNFAPLELNETYDFVYGTEEEPGFRLTCPKVNPNLTFFVVWKMHKFNIIIVDKEILSMEPDFQKKLQEKVGFSKFENNLIKEATLNCIPDELHKLAQTLRRFMDSDS